MVGKESFSAARLLLFEVQLNDLHQALKEHFGYDVFRPLQEQIVRDARGSGHSWTEIAEALGEPKATVHRKWRLLG